MNYMRYEAGLREVAEEVLNMKIPEIPGNIHTGIEILFLERLLHVNGFGNIENEYTRSHKKELEALKYQ